MNRAFQNNKIHKGFFISMNFNHNLGDQHIDDKVMNTVTKAMEQYGDVKFAIKCDYIQWSQVDNHFDINHVKGLSGLNRDIKCTRLFGNRTIDKNLVTNGLNVIEKESFNASTEPTARITKNITSKLNDTRATEKLKVENKDQSRAQKQDNEEAKTVRNNLEVIELDISDQDDKKAGKQKKPRSSGYNRWGKEKDVQLFQTLKQISSEQGVNIEDFWNDDLELTENHQKVLKDLKYQVHWGRRVSAMLQRIRMLAKDQSLSIRQCILLRRLVAQARRSKTRLVVEDIAYMFPGKLVTTLESWLNDFKNKKQ